MTTIFRAGTHPLWAVIVSLHVVAALALVVGVAHASAPALARVDTGKAALKLSAPTGWEVRIEPPRDRHMSMMATLSPNCGVEVAVMIQLDREMETASELLKDQYPDMKPIVKHGWLCVVEGGKSEAMCAGLLRGLSGVVSVYFATTDAAMFRAFDGGELAARVASHLPWSGGDPEALPNWSRDAAVGARASCH